MMRQIKNVVFDVGDVLVHFRYREHMKDLGFSQETNDFFTEHVILSEFWHEMDLGIRTEADALSHFTELYPQYEEELKVFWANTAGLVEEYPYSRPLFEELKAAGHGVYVLSNYPVELSDTHWPTFRFLPLADGYIISGYEKCAKPEEKIYRLLTSRFGLDLGECLFIDDRQVNVDAARSYGMQALLFTGYDALMESLKEMQLL